MMMMTMKPVTKKIIQRKNSGKFMCDSYLNIKKQFVDSNEKLLKILFAFLTQLLKYNNNNNKKKYNPIHNILMTFMLK